MRRDTSKRTTRIRKPYFIVMGAFAAACISFVWIVIGCLQFNNVVAHSSSPIGTQLKFARSGATITVNDIYTDESRSVLIVRFSGSNSEMLKIPYKGTDYQVFVASKQLDGLKKTSVLFGKMSTDGDMFLIIPSPTVDIYSIILMNTNYVAGDNDSSSNSGTSNSSAKLNDDTDAQATSLSKSLSQYKYTDEKNKTGVISMPSDSYDVVAFRVTLEPAFKNDDLYRPKVLPGTLLSKSGKFDFKQFFNAAFKNASMSTLNDQYKSLKSKHEQIEKRMKELQERIASNQNDSDAKAALSSAKTQLSQNESSSQSIADQLTKYSELKYSDKLFRDLQTKATVVSGGF